MAGRPTPEFRADYEAVKAELNKGGIN